MEHFLIALAILILLLLLKAALSQQDKRQKFKSRTFLTPNEMEFLHRLEQAAPELRFHCQVSMGALLEPAVKRYQKGSGYWSIFGQFSQKRIDYVAHSRKTGEIVAVIELDDRTHDAHKDALRDNMLQQAGYLILRFESRRKPSIPNLRQELITRIKEHFQPPEETKIKRPSP